MVAIICIGLYFLIAAIIYFTMYAKAYKRYKKEKSKLEFKTWIYYEDLGIYSLLWPVTTIAQLVCCSITAIENIIKEKINKYGN